MTRPFVAGIGSDHQDDQAGWLVVDRLMQKVVAGTATTGRPALRKLSVPTDLLDWVDESDSLHIVDAAAGISLLTTLRVDRDTESSWLELKQNRQFTKQQSSHGFDIVAMLELARSLKRCPEMITFWLVPAFNTAPGTNISESTETAIQLAVSQLAKLL